ncbi:MAG: putative Flp pilus-assembly TadE/G-like [Chloroflexota bacterium]|jgi:Flp pilus assembly protein TadG|nr:putative Flp pilus-assembly TadE/G-like [Chloroflexota bacterium]
MRIPSQLFRASHRGQESGQVLVLFALAAVVLIGFVGLAVDGGRAYVDRRALQGGADTAAEAATQLLAYNFHQPTTPKTDTDIRDAVAQQVNNSLSQGSGISAFPAAVSTDCDTSSTSAPQDKLATCAWYVDAGAKLLIWPAGSTNAGKAVQVGGGTLPPVCPAESTDPAFGNLCTVGVSVVPQYTHPTAFVRILGDTDATERATATAIFSPVLNVPDIAHYATAACFHGRQIKPGDSVVIFDNQGSGWSSTFTGCGLPNGVGSSNFKGWYHSPVVTNPSTSIPSPGPAGGCTQALCGLYSAQNPGSNPPPALATSGGSKTSYTEFDYFQGAGGTSVGNQNADPQAIALIHSTWVSCQPGAPAPGCQPMLVPVIDYYNGSGSNVDFHIKYFVAVVPDQDWNSNGTWTATVVKNGIVARRAGYRGCIPAAGVTCPPLFRAGLIFISLFH